MLYMYFQSNPYTLQGIVLVTSSLTGTHFMWEVMMMLLRNSADYIQESKAVCMMDMFPVTDSHNIMPFPRVTKTISRNEDCIR